MTLGDIIKKYREENKISMDEFSKRSSLSKGYISMLENNVNPRNNKPIAPTIPTIEKIALGIGSDVDTILKTLDGKQKVSLGSDICSDVSIISQRIKEVREKTGMNKKEFSEYLGIKYTTYNGYETGNREPSFDFLILFSKKLGVSIDYIMGLTNEKDILHSYQLKPDEYDHIKRYRNLDAFGQETVNIALDRETTRVQQINNALKKRPAALRIYTYMNHIACAGNGFYFDDIPTDTIEAPYMEDADFIIGVNGDSMEPTYYDGDMVYVQKRQIIEIGEIGIFFYDNECFIKEAGEEGLISHNDNYPIIPGSENIQCIGKVLGKVPDDSEEESTNNINDFEIHSVNQAFKKALAADKARNRTDKIG